MRSLLIGLGIMVPLGGLSAWAALNPPVLLIVVAAVLYGVASYFIGEAVQEGWKEYKER